jgi:NAD(P)-dependent dehydrogenase (short-subunit alcohol dehydrogenase family)
MERREAPGACETPLGRALRSAGPRAYGEAYSGLPLARRAPPMTLGGCASRRSTARHRLRRRPPREAQGLISGLASRPARSKAAS